MINILERKQDILRVIEQVDISPSMYKNADEKYHALASFLEDCGIDAEMYPHGSFAFGTVVRPLTKSPNASYDLDFVCQLRKTKDQISPHELRQTVESALMQSDRYSDKTHIDESCITIEYADINDISFTIDIVSAADETISRKQVLKEKSSRPDLLDTAIAIPRNNGNRNYSWITNNPRGFQKWFEEINQPFLEFCHESRRQKLYEANRQMFASIDDIPIGLERSSLQRVIQILKYHRDMYYSNLKNKEADALKPISAIINTLVAKIAMSANPQMDTFELLEFVLKELGIYSHQQNISADQFVQKYGTRSAITRSRTNHEWIIPNPADPEDNLADKWNEDAEIPRLFFLWISVCEKDLIQSLNLPDHQFRSTMDNAFGAVNIQKNWAEKYKAFPKVQPKPIITTPKPYKK